MAEAGAPPARRRRSTRKKVSEAEPKSDASDAEASDEEETNTGQSQKLRMPGRRRQRVVSIDAERTVQTDTDRLRSDLLDLVESLKSKKILTGTIQGVERLADNPEMSYAVIYHGDFKVIIPVLEAIEEPEDYRGQPRGDVLHYLLNKRLGAEVDYIVKGVDQENNVVAASRLEAMALKRREYYFRTDGTATIRSMKESVQRPGLSPLSGPASLLICSARSATSRCGNFPISGGWMPHSTISLASACWSRSWRWTAATAATLGCPHR